MPASKVMDEFRKGKLHSGTGKKGRKGKIVRNAKQARAIQISEARKEGYDIPKKPTRKKYARKA